MRALGGIQPPSGVRGRRWRYALCTDHTPPEAAALVTLLKSAWHRPALLLRYRLSAAAGDPRETAIGGNGHSQGKAQIMSQRHPREVVAP